MLKFTATITLMPLWSMSHAKPEMTYVVEARYACRGSVGECGPVNGRNEALELQRKQTRELEQQHRELQKKTEALREGLRPMDRELEIHRPDFQSSV